MNHWPNGKKLTAWEMLELGVEAGIWTREEALDIPGREQKNFKSFVIQHTAQLRWDMMWDGKLTLHTAVREVPEPPKFTVEPWAFELERATK